MGAVAIVPATVDHAQELAPRLAAEHALSAQDFGGEDPVKIIVDGINLSPLCWTGLVDGRPEAIFGMGVGFDGAGWPWLVKSAEAERYRLSFLRGYRRRIAEMLATRPLLEAFISPTHTHLRRWLTFLGFYPAGTAKLGPRSIVFDRWELRA